ncbi:hypothetical protein HJB51_28690 [Rhizobium lentis]|uniref:hypothetical protein n=1 Tax=Rhizobium lentis TaxID=1138194 RepID=UPI001C833485|nr:hypothetical protein [Rhizobium lentis]MBX5056860.1 hypothetical protein [Rhizobium lentis]MBX5074917.1 hypothetical protein [Rhizobium lentis]MBX5111913.1 hypothetical protein [Rhizobium lentis]MBX5118361.1 hypothetical protein [Rhizobium lentis]
MIDLITIAAVHGFRPLRRPSGSEADEDQFYAEFGESSIVRFAAWLTSLDLILRRAASKRTRRNVAAQSCGSPCRAPQATFLVPR